MVIEKLMEMRHFLSYILAAAALSLAGCAHQSETEASKAEQVLLLAEQSAQEGRDKDAFDYAIALTDSGEYTLLPSQLCRQALVLYRISGEGEDVERLVASLTCYERALVADPDSVDAFVSSLNEADRYDMKFIHDLNLRLNHPGDYSDYEMGDSTVTIPEP